MEHCSIFDIPIIFNAPFGHIEDNRLFPLGKKVKIELNNYKVLLSF